MHHQGARRAPSAQVHPKTVSRWATQGLLPRRCTLGGHWRFPEAAICALAASLHQEVQG